MGTPAGKKEKMRYFSEHTELVGILSIFLFWIIFSNPYIFKHLVPFPARQLVVSSSPWSADSSYAGPVKNGAMPDIITQIYPWKHFAISELKSGRIPVWNPYAFSGSPLLANFQSAVFSPFNLLYFILPFIDAWSIVVLLQPLLAGLFIYFFIREYGVSVRGAIISALSFMFCGFITVWMAYGTLAMAIAFLPLALLSTEKYWKTKRLKWLLVLAISIITSLFSGHFQTSLYLLIVVSGFILYKFIFSREIKTFLLVILAMLISLVLALPQLLPTIQFYQLSFRSANSIVEKGIPFYYLVTAFAPDFFGNPVTRNDWVGFYAERASFIGIIPLILAGCSLFSLRKKPILFFFIVGIISLLFSLDTPLQVLLANSMIPVLSSSNPTRIIVIWSFCSAVLAGFGYDQLENMILTKSHRALLLVIFGSITIMGLTILLLKLPTIMPIDKVAIARHNLILPFIIFFLTISSLSFCFFRPTKQILLYLSLLFISLTFLDSYRFVQKWIPFDNRALLYPQDSVISALQNLGSNDRVFGTLGAQVYTYFGIPALDGYDPLYIRRYGEFVTAASKGQYVLPERSVVQLDRRSPSTDKVLDFLSVGYIYHPKNDTYQNWAYPVWERPDRNTVVYEDKDFLIYRNTKALPRARLYYDYHVLPDAKKLLAEFYKVDFPSDKLLLLENDPKIAMNEIATGSARIISLLPNRIVIQVNSTSPGFLFLPDPYYPNWKATINGKETAILQADYAFRAVVIPIGKSEVVFSYRFF